MQASAAITAANSRIHAPAATPLIAAPAIARSQIPALYLTAIALVAGDALGSLRLGLSGWIAIMLCAGAAAAFVMSWGRLAMALALSALFAAAAVAAQRVYDPPAGAATVRALPENAQLVLEGVLDREPEHIHDSTRLYLRLQLAAREGAALSAATGRVRITVLDPGDYRIGQRLRVHTRIRLPRNYGDPGEFDFESYMAREGIAATALVSHAVHIERIGYRPVWLWSTIEALRRHIGSFIDAGLLYPQRAEMRALILGDRGGIGTALRDEFALTGMAHLLVISGLHLGFVASVAFVLIRLGCVPFPRLMILGYSNKLAAIGAGVAVTIFTALAQTHVSTLRALIMVLCYVGAVLADRSREVLASLALAALIVCLTMPGSSTDVGFQLSFAAVLGILLGMRRYEAWWEGVRERLRSRNKGRGELLYTAGGALGAYLAVSFFALVFTAPLTAFYFNQFSLVGLIANAVVVPLMALGGMVIGLIAAALSFVYLPAANGLLQIAGWALALGNRLTGFFLNLPGAWVRTFTPDLLELVLIYSLLALWLCVPAENMRSPAFRTAWAKPGGTQNRTGYRRAIAAALLFALMLDGAWWTRERFFNRSLRVTFLSIGQGDAAVVQFPGSAVMLIDGGAAFRDSSDMGERVIAPFLWSRKIMHVDYLVMSHPELDHFGGFLFITRNFHPTEFWRTGAKSPDYTYRKLLEVLAAAGTGIVTVDASCAPREIGGVTVRCLSPQPGESVSRNNSSMVLDLRLGRWGFLFTGDLEALGENLLLQGGRLLAATVLKVPHHGSITSSTERFIEAVHPSFAVISDGYNNRYHFPSALVVNRYRTEGARLLRTDQSGAIGFQAQGDGLRLWTRWATP